PLIPRGTGAAWNDGNSPDAPEPAIMPRPHAFCNPGRGAGTGAAADGTRHSTGHAVSRVRRAPTRAPAPRSFLLGGDHHDHLAAFHARTGLDHDVLAQVGLDPVKHVPAELLVAHLAAAEPDVDLDLVPIFQELAHLAHLDRVVASVSDRAELHFLDLDLLLLLLRSVGLFLLLEPVLAVIHDPAYRGICGG